MAESLLYILGTLVVALGIGFSIGWHELGHLIPAKLFGVKVPKYMIGFGPTLFSKKIGETEYGIKLIPLGGYISMIGMYPPSKASTSETSETDGENGSSSGRKKFGFFRAMISAARDAHSQYIEPGDENRMFYQLPVWKRMIIMLGGPFMNLILGTVLLTIALSGIGINQTSTTIDQVSACVPVSSTSVCGPTDPPSPALAAGLKSGDKIVEINSVKIETWASSANLLKPDVVNEIKVITPAGDHLTRLVTPVTAQRPVIENGTVKLDAKGNQVLGPRPVLGIILASETKPASIGDSLIASGQSVVQVGQMIFNLPAQVAAVGQTTFGAGERSANGPVSVVGIGQIAGEVASNQKATLVQKLQSELGILASLNFALFAFNLVPLLPLDGGHVAGGVYETLKKGFFRLMRKPDPGPADTALLMPLTYVVFILMLAMSALIIVADLVNPIRF